MQVFVKRIQIGHRVYCLAVAMYVVFVLVFGVLLSESKWEVAGLELEGLELQQE